MNEINWHKDPYKFWYSFTGGDKTEAIKAMNLAIQLKNDGTLQEKKLELVNLRTIETIIE